MKKVFTVAICLFLFCAVAVAVPAWAAGGKVQHENGTDTAPGPGDDARCNQVTGDCDDDD